MACARRMEEHVMRCESPIHYASQRAAWKAVWTMNLHCDARWTLSTEHPPLRSVWPTERAIGPKVRAMCLSFCLPPLLERQFRAEEMCRYRRDWYQSGSARLDLITRSVSGPPFSLPLWSFSYSQTSLFQYKPSHPSVGHSKRLHGGPMPR